MIQLHRLEGFYWVARTGGFSRAARSFPYPITQPAIHQQVSKLERELGTRLFERAGRGEMRLTAAGRYLYDFIGEYFAHLPGVLRSIQSARPGGELWIRAEPMFLRHLLPAWMKRLQKHAPGVRIDLREVVNRDLSCLLRGEADLMVGYFPESIAGVHARQVGSMYPFLVLPVGHRLAMKSGSIQLKDCSDETFISYNPGHIGERLQMRALEAEGVKPKRVISVTSADTILGFVEAGLGYSLVPVLSRKGPDGRGFVARQLPRSETFPVMAVWREGGPPNPMVEAALETAPKVRRKAR